MARSLRAANVVDSPAGDVVDRDAAAIAEVELDEHGVVALRAAEVGELAAGDEVAVLDGARLDAGVVGAG